mgnify:CR=1 FL=1
MIGNLQRDRAEQKQAVFDRIDSARHNAPIQVGASSVDASLLDRHPAVARGRWMADKSILIDNKVHNGVAGYHVVTPLRIEGADICILVNRGWIAAQRLRTELPVLPPLAGTWVDVAGIERMPTAGAYEVEPELADWLVVRRSRT